jgi:hypothetical protein
MFSLFSNTPQKEKTSTWEDCSLWNYTLVISRQTAREELKEKYVPAFKLGHPIELKTIFSESNVGFVGVGIPLVPQLLFHFRHHLFADTILSSQVSAENL